MTSLHLPSPSPAPLQVQPLHSHASSWHTPASTCSSSNNNSTAFSSWSFPWRQQQHCRLHVTQHNPAYVMPCSSSSCGSVRQLSTQSSLSSPLTGNLALQGGTTAAAAATGAAAATSSVQVPSSSSSSEGPPKPIMGICKRRNIKCGWKKIDYVLRMVSVRGHAHVVMLTVAPVAEQGLLTEAVAGLV